MVIVWLKMRPLFASLLWTFKQVLLHMLQETMRDLHFPSFMLTLYKEEGHQLKQWVLSKLWWALILPQCILVALSRLKNINKFLPFRLTLSLKLNEVALLTDPLVLANSILFHNLPLRQPPTLHCYHFWTNQSGDFKNYFWFIIY